MDPEKSQFTKNLASINTLQFSRWAFDAGMLFLSEVKWWGDKGSRGNRHNGLDLWQYETNEGALRTIGEDTRIPVIYEGRIVRCIKDFLGYTVFAAHEIYEKGSQLFTIYGHVLKTSDLLVGKKLNEGTILATLSGTAGNKVPSHLHISVALIPKTIPPSTLSWEALNEDKGVHFFDPKDII